jgi:hypothetical protein
LQAVGDPEHILEEGPLTVGFAAMMRRISREAIPHMPDRISATTPVFLGVPLIRRANYPVSQTRKRSEKH